MDKTKFTINPQLDSEGFVIEAVHGPWVTPRSLYDLSAALLRDGAVTLHAGEYAVVRNPPGWNEPGMQPITWADENPDTTSVDAKKAVADVLTRCWNRIPVGEV